MNQPASNTAEGGLQNGVDCKHARNERDKAVLEHDITANKGKALPRAADNTEHGTHPRAGERDTGEVDEGGNGVKVSASQDDAAPDVASRQQDDAVEHEPAQSVVDLFRESVGSSCIDLISDSQDMTQTSTDANAEDVVVIDDDDDDDDDDNDKTLSWSDDEAGSLISDTSGEKTTAVCCRERRTVTHNAQQTAVGRPRGGPLSPPRTSHVRLTHAARSCRPTNHERQPYDVDDGYHGDDDTDSDATVDENDDCDKCYSPGLVTATQNALLAASARIKVIVLDDSDSSESSLDHDGISSS